MADNENKESTQDMKQADEKDEKDTSALDDKEGVDDSQDDRDEKKSSPKKIEMTQEELDKKFAERATRAEKTAAKKYEKMIQDLNDKIKSFEDKDLSETEKLKKNFEMNAGKVKDLEGELQNAKLENAKMKALFKAGALPDQLDGLMKRVSGGSEEEIETDVDELKSLGWIGSKPEPDQKEPKEEKKKDNKTAQGAGHHQVKDKDGSRVYTKAEIKNRQFYDAHRDDILKAIVDGRIKG